MPMNSTKTIDSSNSAATKAGKQLKHAGTITYAALPSLGRMRDGWPLAGSVNSTTTHGIVDTATSI